MYAPRLEAPEESVDESEPIVALINEFNERENSRVGGDFVKIRS